MTTFCPSNMNILPFILLSKSFFNWGPLDEFSESFAPIYEAPLGPAITEKDF
jgi:hypothetical protein